MMTVGWTNERIEPVLALVALSVLRGEAKRERVDKNETPQTHTTILSFAVVTLHQKPRQRPPNLDAEYLPQ